MKDPNRRRPRGAPSDLLLQVDPRKRKPQPTSSPCHSSWWIVAALLLCSASAFRLLGGSFQPVLRRSWPHSAAHNAVSTAENHHLQPITATAFFPENPLLARNLHSAVSFPDHTLLLFPNYPPRNPPITPACHYPPSPLRLPYISLDSATSSPLHHLLLRCPLPPRNFLHVSPLPSPPHPPLVPHRWDALTYAALLDGWDNSTVAFAKGFSLRPYRLVDPSRFECVFGWRFDKPKLLLPSPALSAAQEVIRCRTPLSVLRRLLHSDPIPAVLVSVRTRGRGGFTLPSLAIPIPVDPPSPTPHRTYQMCVCTMVRNQARFLREWVTYHSRLGVQRWFLYDNNSNDSLSDAVRRLDAEGLNVTRHPWPWIKTQEAGFSHCALMARSSCNWVGFFDVDEFIYLPTPSAAGLGDVLANYTENYPLVGELRTACHSFGPSGQTKPPAEGVTAGYTCRLATSERHKSIVRPEALSPALVNVVHHFQLRDRFEYVNVDRSRMVINHYKYQVWEVFKEKFYRRVATYVADWQDEENAGSKDRAPGLGTRAVEPPDWPTRFCEVQDTGLRNWVLAEFTDPTTGRLPWSSS